MRNIRSSGQSLIETALALVGVVMLVYVTLKIWAWTTVNVRKWNAIRRVRRSRCSGNPTL